MKTSTLRWMAASGCVAAIALSCGSGDEGDSAWNPGNPDGGAGTAGTAGSSGSAGAAGTAGTAGKAGAGGMAGSTGGGAGQDAGQGGTGGSTSDGSVEPDGSSGGADAADDVTLVCEPVVVAAAPDPWNQRLPSKGFGGITPPGSGANKDVFLSSPAPNPDYLRIGARLNWGGSIVFFGLSANAQSNVIDANDTGRELQIALYDPSRIMQNCAWNASCQSTPTTCANSITFLGWNPVQGGDECGHGSTAEWSQQGDALRVITHPLQWNPDWDKHDCTQSPCGASGVPVAVDYVTDLRFVSSHVVEVAMELQSKENFSHPVTGQEFPTLYVAHGQNGPDLPVLLDASGGQISLSTPANDGFFMGNFDSPGPWVSWQNNTKDYGVGIAMDQGIRQWQGWRADSPYFHNVRARIEFGLPAGKVVRGVSYLALGGFTTVKSELEGVLAKRPPFGILDQPAAGTTVTVAQGADVQLSGWVLDTDKLSSVKVSVNGQAATDLAVNGARPDVCEVYPAYSGCPSAGFSGTISTSGWDTCPHLVKVSAQDGDGNETMLGEVAVTAK